MASSMQFLDIDLDAFLDRVVYRPQGTRRPSATEYLPWAKDALVGFLEEKCGLSAARPIPGRFAIEHDAAFFYWREIIDEGFESLEVVHIDGHADLGLGEPAWVQVATEQLTRDVVDRRHAPAGPYGVTPGTYLLYAIAARWLSNLTYVSPIGGGNDLPALHFRDNDPTSGFIELKSFRPEAGPPGLGTSLNYHRCNAKNALHIEPAIPFTATKIDKYLHAGKPFERAFVCQSPRFAPFTSDQLLPILGRYISFDCRSADLPTVDNARVAKALGRAIKSRRKHERRHRGRYAVAEQSFEAIANDPDPGLSETWLP